MSEIYLLERIGNIDEKYIEMANKASVKKRNWYIPTIAAACVAILLCLFFVTRNYNVTDEIKTNEIILEKSKGIKVSFTDETINIETHADLIELTEEQIFNDFNNVIIRGTVQEIHNIAINNGSDIEYNALLKISVSSVIRGDCEEGMEIDILIPCPINEDIWVEDTGVISQAKVGVEGIFMPIIYDESSYSDYGDGHILYMIDIAKYGLADGERFVFLDVGEKLAFANYAFPKLSQQMSLDDIEEYIKSKK